MHSPSTTGTITPSTLLRVRIETIIAIAANPKVAGTTDAQLAATQRRRQSAQPPAQARARADVRRHGDAAPTVGPRPRRPNARGASMRVRSDVDGAPAVAAAVLGA